MNRLFLLAAIIFFTVTVQAQTLGISINPAIDLPQGMNKPYFGTSCGLFYDQKIYKILGFSTGIDYSDFRQGGPWGSFDEMNSFSENYRPILQQLTHLVEIPVTVQQYYKEIGLHNKAHSIA